MIAQNLWAVPRFVWTHPANRGRRVRALLGAAGWQIYKRATGRARDLHAWGLTLRCYPDSTSASLVLYCAGRPDWHEMGFMARYLRAGDGFVDVGANIGVYTLFARSLVGPTGRLEAFEPGEKALRRLRENLALNGLADQVRVHACALGAEAGTVRFSTRHDTTNAIVTEDAAGADEFTQVPCARLDDVLAGRYAMGKMDIEGAEPLALQGAGRLLGDANPPVWLLEMNGACRRYGWSEDRLAAWLAQRGYDLALYDADVGTLDFGPRPWLRQPNVLAIARGARSAVLERLGDGPLHPPG